MITIIPIPYRILFDNSLSTFYSLTIIVRLYRIVRYIHKRYQKGRDEVQRQNLTIFLTVSTMITISAAFIQAVENPYREFLINEKK